MARACLPPVQFDIEQGEVEGRAAVVVKVHEAVVSAKPWVRGELRRRRSWDGDYPMSELEEQAFLARREQPTSTARRWPRYREWTSASRRPARAILTVDRKQRGTYLAPGLRRHPLGPRQGLRPTSRPEPGLVVGLGAHGLQRHDGDRVGLDHERPGAQAAGGR